MIITGTAEFSECGTYRYLLTRNWDYTAPVMCWIMLNPSTATGEEDDPTIRRCIEFARSAGCGGLWVVNLFALRSSDPAALVHHPDPAGPDNYATVQQRASSASLAVAAWGAPRIPGFMARRNEALFTLAGVPLLCLGTTRSGEPRHPLFVPSGTPFVPWSAQ